MKVQQKLIKVSPKYAYGFCNLCVNWTVQV